MKLGLRFRLLMFLCATFTAGATFAQTQAVNGSIRGRVTDASSAPVPGAQVTVKNDETGFTRSIETSDDGYYVIPNLPLGTYTVTVQKSGFETQRHTGVTLETGIEAVIDSQIKVGSVSTTVEVTGGAPILETSRVDVGRTISYSEIANLPLTSRNPYNFIIFQPGVSGHPNPELGIPRTLNMNGLLDRINYQMDGMVDTESDRYGLRLFPISDVYVREVQTVSNSFAPEFGNTAGDIYNVITNSGTNTWHGLFQYIGRPVDLSARPILLGTNPKPDLTLADSSFNAGGALMKDKLFIFGGYEHLERGLPAPDTINPANAAQIGLPASLLAVAPSVQHAQFLDLRIDWNVSSKHQVFLRYNYFRNEYPFNTAVGGLNALDAASDFRDRAHVLGAQILSTFSPTMLNEIRFGWPYRNEKHFADPLTGPGPQISISGIANFGGSTAVGDRFQEKIPNLNDNLTLIKGAHTIKMGFGFEHPLDTQTNDVYSQFVFPTIAAYLSAKSGDKPFSYTTFNTVVGLPGSWYHSFFWNFFAQDSWQVRPSLLLIYGLRYDRFQGPPGEPNAPFAYTQHFRTPGGDFAPRLGLAWSLNSKTVLRVSSGVFYETPPTNLWYNAFVNDGTNRAFVASISSGSPLAPPFPQTLSTLPASFTRVPDVTGVTPNFKNAYTINSSIRITRQLSTADALTLGYVHTGARNLEYLRNLNLINPIGALADGRPIFSSTISAATRLYPQFGNLTVQDIGAITNYDALIVNLRHRFARGFDMNASYTWSHSISDAPDANSFEQNTFLEDSTSRARDRGNSSVNRPQALTVSTIVEPRVSLQNRFWNRLANDNSLAILANISSGDEQNITANRTLNGDPKAVTRPLFIGRNAVRGPNIYEFDLRYTRTLFTLWERVQPKFLAEATNVFNHPNITALNTVVPVDTSGNPTSGLPTRFPALSTVLEGRIVQFGIRVDF